MWLVSVILVVFGLILTWHDKNVGEGQNFILAGLVIALLSGPVGFDFFKRRV